MRGPRRVAALPGIALLLTLSGGRPAVAAPGAVTGFDSAYAGESVFTAVGAGATGPMSAIFFNSGTPPWAPGGVGLLVCLAHKTTRGGASPHAAYAKGWLSSSADPS